jgi:hypothetical protein
MIDARTAIGSVLEPLTAVAERGRLRFFAEAIGETDPRYTDLEAARAAGYPDLPVPPTFLFGLKLDSRRSGAGGSGSDDALGWLTDLGVDVRYVLHGSQRFSYDRLAFAGDELVLSPRITDVYDKRGGALEFVVVDTTVTRGGERIATLTETVIVQHPEGEGSR